MAARWALGLLACAWTGGAMLLPLDCDADLRISYDQITYYNSVVNCGNLFLKSDIAIEPTVRFPRANPNKTYTLLYISTESDTNPPRSWPDVVSDGLVHLHWIVGDVTPGMLLGEGNVSAATKIHGDDWPRHGPSPTQPYIFFLVEHEGPTPALEETQCFPGVSDFCTQEDFLLWLDGQKWRVVAKNHLTGLYYDDAFRAPSATAKLVE